VENILLYTLEYAQEELNYTDDRTISLNKNKVAGIKDISIFEWRKALLRDKIE
jgi:hypothetical protein